MAINQHLIELASVEDDGGGDELSVICEIEFGTTVLETATLPGCSRASLHRKMAASYRGPATV